nr:substrate-binding domain-containing protein [Roseospira visakhapatnamensis]
MVLAAAGSAHAQAGRDYVSVIGSRATHPYVSHLVEHFGQSTRFKYPRVETTETRAVLKLLCGGLGAGFPDVAMATRPIDDAERARCRDNMVGDVLSLPVGFDTVVLATARREEGPPLALTARHLFLALAARVPDPATADESRPALVANPYRRWSAIDPALPDLPIRVVLPPVATTATDILAESILARGCRDVMGLQTPAAPCGALRDDAAVERLSAPSEDLVATLKARAGDGAIALLRPSDVAAAAALVGLPIDGVPPTRARIADYPAARPLYLIVKPDHVDLIPGLRAFIAMVMDPALSGPAGSLTHVGLVPLPEEIRADHAARAGALIAVPDTMGGHAGDDGDGLSPHTRLRTIETALWRAVRHSDDPDTIRTYLSVFPDGVFARRAQQRIAVLTRRGADREPGPEDGPDAAR